MKYKVLIDPQAKLDIKEIFVYVLQNDDLRSAGKILDGLEKTCYNLEKFPEHGHIPPELRETGIIKYREIHYSNYRIIYEIDGGEIYVPAVLDGRRNIQEILSSRLLR